MAIFGSKPGLQQVGKPDKRAVNANTPRLLRLGWLGLKAADTIAEARFLENILKLKFVDETNSGEGHFIRYNSGSLDLELVGGGATWATRGKPRHGQPDISLVPSLKYNDLDKFETNLRDREVPHTRPYEQGWGASLFFFDPERNLWQANQTRVEPDVPAGHQPCIAALWLSVEDFAAQEIFYRDVLGLELVNEGEYLPPITEAAEHYQQTHPVSDPAPTGLDLTPTHATGAVFEAGEVKFALSPGGQRLENSRERVWGVDTAFLPGFQTNDLDGFSRRLAGHGVKTTGPYPYYHISLTPRGPQWRAGSALRFCDPEGHPIQVYQ